MIMKKTRFPYISFATSIISMLALIGFTIFEIIAYYDISTAEYRYGNDTMPLVGLAVLVYPIIALYGVVSSWYCGANANTIWLKIVSHIMLIVFSLILLPFCLWFLATIIGLIF
jgi:hypothetical protein